MRHKALQLAAGAVERRLNADLSDRKGPARPCACGEQARYAGRLPKTFETALGVLALERACCHCRHCGRGIFPRDRAFGMARTGLSPAVTRMTGSAAATAGFAHAGPLLAGVRVETKRVERTAEASGREIAAVGRDRAFPPEKPPSLTSGGVGPNRKPGSAHGQLVACTDCLDVIRTGTSTRAG